VWLPAMGTIKAHEQQKLLSVATTRVLCEAPALQTQEVAALWSQLLQSLLAQIEDRAQPAGALVEEENEEGISGGYSAAFAKLHNAALLEPEALPNVPDASRYLAESIGKYSQAHPGRVAALVQHIQPQGQQQLQQYCQTVGISIA